MDYLILVSDLKAFVNADFEYKNYTGNSFNYGDDSAEELEAGRVNSEINTQLQSGFNIKLGGELAYKKFRVRAGANLVTSPFVDETYNSISNLYSFGLGYRKNKFFIDAAFQTNSSTAGYTPYRVLDETQNQWTNYDTKRNKILVTMGFKF